VDRFSKSVRGWIIKLSCVRSRGFPSRKRVNLFPWPISVFSGIDLCVNCLVSIAESKDPIAGDAHCSRYYFPAVAIKRSGKRRESSATILTQKNVAFTAAAKPQVKLVSTALFPSMLFANQRFFLSISCHCPSPPPQGLCRCDLTTPSAQSRFVVLVVVMRRPSVARRKLEILCGIPRQASRQVLEMLHQVQSSLQLPCVGL